MTAVGSGKANISTRSAGDPCSAIDRSRPAAISSIRDRSPVIRRTVKACADNFRSRV
jgi:hypothetical protein